MKAMTRSRALKRFDTLYGGKGPWVGSFLPRGRSQYILYAVALSEHPGVTKVGRTTRWDRRRASYARWNLSDGDAIAAEQTFVITEEFVDLAKLEAALLAGLPFPTRHGREWFVADFDDVCRAIERFLCEHGLSYV